MDTAKKVALVVLVFSVVSLIATLVAPRVSAANSQSITLFAYDPDTNTVKTLTWPYFDRGMGCDTYTSPDQQYRIYEWSHSLGIYPAALVIRDGRLVNKYFWMAYYTGYFYVGNDTSGTYYLAWFLKRSVTSEVDCGELSYRDGGGSQGGLQVHGPANLSNVISASGYPLYFYDSGWKALSYFERLVSGNAGSACTDGYYYLQDYGVSGIGSVHNRTQRPSRVLDFEGYLPDQDVLFIESHGGYSCYTSSDDLYPLYVGLFAVKDYHRYRIDLSAQGWYYMARGPCDIAVVYDTHHRARFVTGINISGGTATVSVGPEVPKGASAIGKWIYNGDHMVCAILGTEYYYDPISHKLVKVNGVFPLVQRWRPPGSAFVEVNGVPYYIVADLYNLGNTRDGDGVPDFATGDFRMHWYEFAPIKVNGIRFLSAPVVPRGEGAADLNFVLDYDVWPGALIKVQNISVTVDGHYVGELNALSDVASYRFTYGDHEICYRFTVKNDDDFDGYNECYHVHIGYAPWNVAFTYEYNANKVTLVASAQDDGTIVKYVWDVNAPGGSEEHYESDSPVYTITVPGPGDYNVSLTVVDNDGVAVTVTGSFTVASKEVPSGVKYHDVTVTTVSPEVHVAHPPMGHLSVAGVSIPASAVISAVVALLALAYIVVV